MSYSLNVLLNRNHVHTLTECSLCREMSREKPYLRPSDKNQASLALSTFNFFTFRGGFSLRYSNLMATLKIALRAPISKSIGCALIPLRMHPLKFPSDSASYLLGLTHEFFLTTSYRPMTSVVNCGIEATLRHVLLSKALIPSCC